MIVSLGAWLGTLAGRATLIASLVASLVALRAYDIRNQRAIGAEKAVARIEKATDNAIEKGKAAAARSGASAAGGLRKGAVDPSTRHD